MTDTDKLQEVQIDSLVYGGNGMGRLSDGKAVFVPYTLPGEKALVRLVDEQPRYAVAELVQVLEPSGEREAPKCKHFGICGGCQYQHFSYPQQVACKKSHSHRTASAHWKNRCSVCSSNDSLAASVELSKCRSIPYF